MNRINTVSRFSFLYPLAQYGIKKKEEKEAEAAAAMEQASEGSLTRPKKAVPTGCGDEEEEESIVDTVMKFIPTPLMDMFNKNYIVAFVRIIATPVFSLIWRLKHGTGDNTSTRLGSCFNNSVLFLSIWNKDALFSEHEDVRGERRGPERGLALDPESAGGPKQTGTDPETTATLNESSPSIYLCTVPPADGSLESCDVT
ncbi:Complexin-1 [Liparis tanakae]|uniref:Complexin-1 n=1 Tax=Liparis tanakae TaxID=230148 RepID=A0A4Z2HQ63_9TELE|nr:Complexin-1 [Liparis tanakae]